MCFASQEGGTSAGYVLWPAELTGHQPVPVGVFAARPVTIPFQGLIRLAPISAILVGRTELEPPWTNA